MPRASKKAPKKCCSHEFSLKPCREHLKRPQNLTLSYCSKHGEQKSMCTGNSCDCFQAPTFNIDQSHASPTFILPSDSDYYRMRKDDIIREHQVKYKGYTEQLQSINVPKPKSRSCYCSVCKVHYEDYLQHIKSVTHKRKIGVNVFSKYIKELSQNFVKKSGRYDSNRQTYQQAPQSDEQDELSQISSPIKKIKTSTTVLDLTPHVVDQRTAREKLKIQQFQKKEDQYFNNFQKLREIGRKNLQEQGGRTINFTYNMNYFMNPFQCFNPPLNFHNNYMYPMNQCQVPMMDYFKFQNPAFFNMNPVQTEPKKEGEKLQQK